MLLEKLTGISCSKAKHLCSYGTFMRCEEYSAIHKKDIVLCSGVKSKVDSNAELWVTCLCHIAFHYKSLSED